LFDLVGPALALALGIRLFEEISAAHVEDVVTDSGTQTLVLWAKLVQETGVERRSVTRISGVRVSKRADFFVACICEPNVFPELLEVSVGGDVELCDDGEERALVLPVNGSVAGVRDQKR
jgi:hypothetical protein